MASQTEFLQHFLLWVGPIDDVDMRMRGFYNTVDPRLSAPRLSGPSIIRFLSHKSQIQDAHAR